MSDLEYDEGEDRYDDYDDYDENENEYEDGDYLDDIENENSDYDDGIMRYDEDESENQYSILDTRPGFKDRIDLAGPTNINGIEDLTTHMAGAFNNKLSHITKSFTEIFKSSINNIKKEYNLSDSVANVVEGLTDAPNIESKNVLALMLAVSVLKYDIEDGTTLDEKLFLELKTKNINVGDKDAKEYTILDKAKASQNVTEFTVLRYIRYILPYVNSK